MTTLIKCPHCGQSFDLTSSNFKPFCSERCKLIDLGAWADGSYSIPAEDTPMSEQTSDSEIDY